MEVKISPLTIFLLAVMFCLLLFCATLILNEEFLLNMDATVTNFLNLTVDVIYFIGGMILLFGVLLMLIKFLRSKLGAPYKPSNIARSLQGYLTLSLEFFIGAEIIRTALTRSFEEVSVLILIIVSRGILSLILYLEHKWHGTAETE